MLAVPRDTLVDIPDVGRKINAAFASGAPELTVATLEKLTGVRIDDVVVVNFGGVEEIVDALGGIALEVDNPIRVGIGRRRVDIPAGTHTPDGLQALARESTSPAKLPPLPAKARATWHNIDTNMNAVEAARFAIRTRRLRRPL